MSAEPAAAIRFRDLTLGYGRLPAVRDLAGSVREGDLLAVVGPNGAGKSSLLKGIVGQVEVLGGSLDLCGRAVSTIGYLPQRSEIDLAFPISVFDFVATGAWHRIGAWRTVSRPEVRRVEEALGRVSLTGFEPRPIGTLSGGQLQRALFARTIVQDARLILLDEPLAAIDERTSADLVEVIAVWEREGRTVLAALHDLDLVRRRFPQTLLLAGEPIAWGATASVLTAPNLARSRRVAEAVSAAGEAWGAGSRQPAALAPRQGRRMHG